MCLLAAFVATTVAIGGIKTAVSLGSSPAAAVCGASFRDLPSGWHQSGAPSALIIDGSVPSTTFSWAATPTSVSDLERPLPADGIYIWVILKRPKSGPHGAPLRTPLELRDASVIAQEGAPRLPEYRFAGRYRDQYAVTVGADFGSRPLTAHARQVADRVLRQLVLPRWVPFSRRSTC